MPSSQHLQLTTDLSRSVPGQGEVIVVEGKKLSKRFHCAQSGLFASHPSLALPQPCFLGGLVPAGCFCQAQMLDGFCLGAVIVGTGQILAGGTRGG